MNLTLAPIVRALGGDLYARGQRANIPGPGHSVADRSVSLALAGRRVLVHCFAGDDWRDVLDDLRRRGLVDGAGRLAGAASVGERGSFDRRGRRVRVATAERLWSEAKPIGGTVAERHLRRRGIGSDPGPELRCHFGVPAAVYDDRGPRRPALLAAIRAPNGALVGVEVTYLASNGERARLAIPRKTIGLSPSGAAVRLDPAGPRLLVGEGVFTCLSAAARFGLPAWALLSVRGLRAWRPPAGVGFVLIAADRGGPGEAAARALARDLAAVGVGSEIRLPPAPHGDWNEALGTGTGSGEAEEGRVGAGAADGRSGPPARRSDP